MKIVYPFYLLIFVLLYSCGDKSPKSSPEQWKQEIIETEAQFAQMAGEVGIREAFLSFAAEDAVLMRNDSLVIGKEGIARYLNAEGPSGDISLTWKPDFVDVSASGDLGYTYGKFTFSVTDSTGTRMENTGVFHTVWKRQADGSWKFVWD
jgi:ketosteroid isomerase-like protein